MLVYIYNAPKLALDRLNQQMDKKSSCYSFFEMNDLNSITLTKAKLLWNGIDSIIIEIEMWVLI